MKKINLSILVLSAFIMFFGLPQKSFAERKPRHHSIRNSSKSTFERSKPLGWRKQACGNIYDYLINTRTGQCKDFEATVRDILLYGYAGCISRFHNPFIYSSLNFRHLIRFNNCLAATQPVKHANYRFLVNQCQAVGGCIGF
jgi:hypothetical protein